MRTILPLLLMSSLWCYGQAPAPSVPNAWDIAPVIEDFSAKAQRLKPLLDELKPQEWVQKGAPDTYLSQLVSAEQEMDYLTKSAKLLQEQPEKLTLAFDTYFRWESLHARLGTLREGARRYQDPNIGDLLEAVFAVNVSNHDKLRQYISDLASQKEEEFSVVNREAQRCRGVLSQQPPARSQGKQ
jgi:hypothetical protein